MLARLFVIIASAASLLLAACTHERFAGPDVQLAAEEDASIKDGDRLVADGYPIPVASAAVSRPGPWGPPTILASDVRDQPYRLDTGDRLRIFIYGQPNLSRLYTVDQEGKIAVPLIGNVMARGKTATELQAAIRSRLGSEYVKDPQVTVDIQQNRPFFILGEVKNAGQFPFVSGMSVETAVAIAGGYTERASESRFRITRRVNGYVEQFEVPPDYPLSPGDTVYVFERFF